MRGRLVSEGLSLSILSLAGDQRQLPCGDDYKEYVVHLDSGFAIHCILASNFLQWMAVESEFRYSLERRV